MNEVKREKLFASIAAVETGNYTPSYGDMFAIMEKESDRFELCWTMFKFGFLKGQRAEKAKHKKKEVKV